MSTLHADALRTLEENGWDEAAWCRLHGRSEPWSGDACGCLDDWCIGFHHEESDACSCLPALIDEIRTGEYLSAAFAHVWALRQGDPERADARLAELIAEYFPATVWHGYVDRGIAYRNQFNESTWLIFDAATGVRVTEEL